MPLQKIQDKEKRLTKDRGAYRQTSNQRKTETRWVAAHGLYFEKKNERTYQSTLGNVGYRHIGIPPCFSHPPYRQAHQGPSRI